MKKNLYLFVFILSGVSFFIKSSLFSNVLFSDLSALLISIFFLLGTTNFRVKKFKIINIFAYFGYNFLLTSSLILLGSNLTIISYLYTIRELSYIIIYSFFLFYIINQPQRADYIFKCFFLSNAIYGLFSIINGNIAYYGIGSISSISPSQSGILYFIIYSLSLYRYLYGKEKIYLFIVVTSFISVFATSSRTSIIGLLAFSFILLLIYLVNKKSKPTKLYLILIIFSTFTLIFFMIFKNSYSDFSSFFIKKVISRFGYLGESYDFRKNVSITFINRIVEGKFLRILFGSGKGIPEIINGTKTLAVDNQYTRAILEMGIIGSVLWVNMLSSLINDKNNKSGYSKFFVIALTVSYFIMGFGYEIFQVSKGGLGYWLSISYFQSIEQLKIQKMQGGKYN